MRLLVVGLGSMGRRRIRLLQKYDSQLHIIGVDSNNERRQTCEEEYGIKTYVSLEAAINENKIDAVFVCTSPLSHNGIINECLSHKINVFTELNLNSDGYGENIAAAKRHGLVLFMSSTFLYREEIKKIRSLMKESDCLVNYSYHVGQYLPDWHPWENYKDYFVGDKRTNGCREIFAIELPWLTNVFGDITKVDVVKNKISSLNISYNDNYLLIIQHSTGHKGILAVDVVSRKAVRNLEVFGENIHLQWDGSTKGLDLYDYSTKQSVKLELYAEIDKLEGYSSSIIENAYMDEIIDFFEILKGNREQAYTFEKDWEILKLIDTIEA